MAAGGMFLSEGYPLALWISVTGALLGSFQYGYIVAILNTAESHVKKDIAFENEPVLSSAVVLGAAFGAFSAGTIADKLGPKKAQLLNVLAFIVGACVTCFSGSKTGFLSGRVVSGVGAGAASLYAPRYIAEIAPSELRGNLGTQHQVFINVGILCAYCAGLPYERGVDKISILGFTGPIPWWKLMIIFAVVPAFIQFVTLLCCPESPLWLESKDKEAADESCIRLWGSKAILYEAAAEQEAEDDMNNIGAPLLQPLTEERNRNESWSALWNREYRWMMALAIGLPLLQQATGINTVILYSSEVFTAAGLKSPIVGSIIMGLVNVVFTLLAGLLMDRLGRRPLLLFSVFGMGVCLFAVSMVDYLTEGSSLDGMVTALLLNLYVALFAIGSGPITWVYLSEILPERIKGKAAALATTLCWIALLLVSLSFPPLECSLDIGGVYMIYATLNVCSFVYVYYVMVETKCRTLREIEKMLLLSPIDRLSRLFMYVSSPGASHRSREATPERNGDMIRAVPSPATDAKLHLVHNNHIGEHVKDPVGTNLCISL